MPESRTPRLGDIVDDYCSRCRLVMNHGVVGIVEGKVKRTRCNTCLNEHAYRAAKIPAQKKDKVKDLFDQVLAGIPQFRAPRKPEGDAGTARPEPPEAISGEDEPEASPDDDADRPYRRRRTPHLGMRPPGSEPPPEPADHGPSWRRRTPHLGMRPAGSKPAPEDGRGSGRRRTPHLGMRPAGSEPAAEPGQDRPPRRRRRSRRGRGRSAGDGSTRSAGGQGDAQGRGTRNKRRRGGRRRRR